MPAATKPLTPDEYAKASDDIRRDYYYEPDHLYPRLIATIERQREQVKKLRDACDQLVSRHIPTGFHLVPTVITIDMSIAFAETWFSKKRCIDDEPASDMDWYTALLEASPSCGEALATTGPKP